MSVETHLLYAVHGPIVAALLVSLQTHLFIFSVKNWISDRKNLVVVHNFWSKNAFFA